MSLLIAVALITLPAKAETINEGQVFPEFTTMNVDSLCVWTHVDFNNDARIILPFVDSESMNDVAGQRGELVFNDNDGCLYICVTTGNPAAWIQIKDFS